MPGVLRFDTGSLGRVQRTPQGGIRVPATLRRVGLLRYTNPDGSTRVEYCPSDEMFQEDSLATLRDAPVTNLHHGVIDPSNYRRAAVGALSGNARQDGDKLEAYLAIQDAQTISLIDSGERCEVSCGYHVTLDHTPGTTSAGERYDVIQRKIVYNHVALVPRGRAGREVALRLDSTENQIRPEGQTEFEMKIEIIGGVDYEVGTAAHRKAVESREDSERTYTVRLDEASKLEGENVALKAENKGLKERLDAAPKALDAAVKTRVALLVHAERAKIEGREDMSDEDIRRALIGEVLPEIDLEGKDAGFVAGVFASAVAQMESTGGSSASASNVREDALRAKRGKKANEREDASVDLPPDIVSRNKMIKEGRNRASIRHGLDKT